MKYRFQWTYPIVFSPHDSGVLYVAGNRAFRSTDQGSSWEVISPDLTRNDVTRQEASGGPVTKDTTNAETYCTIFSFVESPHEKGLFWAGSDDGLVHISRDGGGSWSNVTPPDLPDWSLISVIEVSPHDPATAYLAATIYKLDDPRPMLYKTSDYGHTWTDISAGIPGDDYTRVIREDPGRRGLLYVGTETGVYVSFDDGASWQPMQGNLPRVPIYDLVVKEDDLLAATHGRSFWIMDDVTQLRQLAEELAGEPLHLLKPRATYRMPVPAQSRRASTGKIYQLATGAAVTFTESKDPEGQTVRKFLDAGENPPDGVVVTYYLKEKPEEATLTFQDSDGQAIKTFSSIAPEKEAPSQDPRVRAESGMNRFVWNMRYSDSRKVPGDKTTEDLGLGPVAVPGAYQVTLTADGQSQSQSFEIVKDPRLAATQDDLQAQFDMLIKVRDKLSETQDAINELRSITRQVDEWVKRASGHSSEQVIAEAAAPLKEKLSEIEAELVQVAYTGPGDRLNLPTKLNRRLAELTAVVASADFAPTKQAIDVFADFGSRIDPQIRRLKELEDEDVSRFANLVHELDLPPIIPSAAT